MYGSDTGKETTEGEKCLRILVPALEVGRNPIYLYGAVAASCLHFEALGRVQPLTQQPVRLPGG